MLTHIYYICIGKTLVLSSLPIKEGLLLSLLSGPEEVGAEEGVGSISVVFFTKSKSGFLISKRAAKRENAALTLLAVDPLTGEFELLDVPDVDVGVPFIWVLNSEVQWSIVRQSWRLYKILKIKCIGFYLDYCSRVNRSTWGRGANPVAWISCISICHNVLIISRCILWVLQFNLVYE